MLVNLALLLAFVQAPFLHVHEHESTEHHQGALFHTHFGHVSVTHSTQPELRDLDPDDDALFQSWFSVSATDAGFTPVILTSSFCVPSPRITNWRAVDIEPSAHGPPLLNATNPRPPPV